jgi:hypothetical protein
MASSHRYLELFIPCGKLAFSLSPITLPYFALLLILSNPVAAGLLRMLTQAGWRGRMVILNNALIFRADIRPA